MSEEPTNIPLITFDSFDSPNDTILFQKNIEVVTMLNKLYSNRTFHIMDSPVGIDVNGESIQARSVACNIKVSTDTTLTLNEVIIPIIDQLIDYSKQHDIYLYMIVVYNIQNKLQFKIRGHF